MAVKCEFRPSAAFLVRASMRRIFIIDIDKHLTGLKLRINTSRFALREIFGKRFPDLGKSAMLARLFKEI